MGGDLSREHFQAYAKNAEHNLNHRTRLCLGGRNSCRVYFEGKNKHKFSKRERREIYDWTTWLVGDILNDIGVKFQKKVEKIVANSKVKT
jgi:hypothetical protein